MLYDFKKHWAEAGTAPSELQAQNLRIKILEKHVLLFWAHFCMSSGQEKALPPALHAPGYKKHLKAIYYKIFCIYIFYKNKKYFKLKLENLRKTIETQLLLW